MKIHVLAREQRLKAPLDQVFPFFARPENLEKLTPPGLGFQILTPSPIPMHVGAIIDYVVSLNGLPMRWTTCISEYEPPYRFVDVQLKGPYAFWHHTHTFEDLGGETLVRDEVRYGLPGGPLGEIAHALMVRRQLESIFNYRRTFLEDVGDWRAATQLQAVNA
ncbi:MAG: SRPBCC family protein [Candidatus Hydrogenedentes bacterium]|nr:SRPBCC family protein [Candidatus Hydrogenedentota bacterium]